MVYMIFWRLYSQINYILSIICQNQVQNISTIVSWRAYQLYKIIELKTISQNLLDVAKLPVSVYQFTSGILKSPKISTGEEEEVMVAR